MPIRTFGDWRVYADYIAHTNGYELTIGELTRGGVDWDAHMRGKRWCNLADFVRARDLLLWMASDPGVAA